MTSHSGGDGGWLFSSRKGCSVVWCIPAVREPSPARPPPIPEGLTGVVGEYPRSYGSYSPSISPSTSSSKTSGLHSPPFPIDVRQFVMSSSCMDGGFATTFCGNAEPLAAAEVLASGSAPSRGSVTESGGLGGRITGGAAWIPSRAAAFDPSI